MSRRVSLPMLLLASGMLGGCANLWPTGSETPLASSTLPLTEQLGILPVVVEKTRLPDADLVELRDGYARLASRVDDQNLTRLINLRLADLEMFIAENEQVQGQSEQALASLQRAKEAYQRVLTLYPDERTSADVLYQLSRAQDLSGQQDESMQTLDALLRVQPDSLEGAEAKFRQAELFYGRGDYASAAAAYRDVLRLDSNGRLQQMAAYMLGWSWFKLEQPEQALRAFDRMLTISFQHLPAAANNFAYAPPRLAALTPGAQKLTRDALRVMAELFSYQGSGKAITAFYQFYGESAHAYLVYDELAQQYLDSDRFQDAADAYLSFALAYPTHEEAVTFYVKHVDAFVLGDFPSEVVMAKQGFVDLFGVSKGIYSQLSVLNREKATPFLLQYITELSATYHSLAQQLAAELPTESSRAYVLAAESYREFIALFPSHEKRPDMQFFLAESLYESGKLADAIVEYESFAYAWGQHPRAADAAYTALLAHRQLGASEAQRKSQDDFLRYFSHDERSIRVAQALMQECFDSQQYQEAIYYSQWLQRPPEALRESTPSEVYKAALLVSAHSHFALEEYLAAEQYYADVLALEHVATEPRADLTRNLALAIYRQGEASLQRGELASAIRHFERIISVAPDTDIRINAQYDAATYLLQLNEYTPALAWLMDFQQRYPSHPLTAGIDEKRLYIYEQTEAWQNAADLLMQQAPQEAQSDAAADALWTAANYYLRANAIDKALPVFRQYAHTYAKPFDRVMEARWQMSEFYRQSGESEKRVFWLKKLMEGQASATDERTPRTTTLAAMAASVFAEDARAKFNAIKLVQPLKKNLARKREALKEAVNAYEQVIGYGVREYVTQSSHALGELYLQLADDLLASERPKGLDELAREQYDILLTEQAYPFEQQGLSLLENNAQRSWQGIYDDGVKASFATLAKRWPLRYGKDEVIQEVGGE